MARVTCPGCGAPIDPGVSICPMCDHILDASFLEGAAEPPSAEDSGGAARDDATRPRARMPAPPPGRSATGARKSAARAPGSAPARTRPVNGSAPPKATRSPAPSARGAPKRAMPEAPVREVRAEPAAKRDYAALAQEYAQEPPSGPAKPAFQVQKMTSAEEAYAEARSFMGNLASGDKIAMVGLALVILVSFFPWKVMAREGEVLGLLSLGAIGTAGAALAACALYARVQRLLPNVNPAVPWVAQLGAICFTILWCLVYIKISWDGTLLPSIDGNIRVPASKPDIGVYSALVSAILALGGTLMGLRDQQPR